MKINGPSQRLGRIVNFEGWVQRELRKEEEMEQEYYWEDCLTEGESGCYQFYHVWRLNGSCDLVVGVVMMISTAMAPPFTNPFNLQHLRAL